jgi:hypothetical protein
MPAQAKTHICDKWQAIEEDFITDAIARFENFARVIEGLPENEKIHVRCR